MDTQTYFNAMAMSMAANPPVMPEDATIVAEMAKIGLVPGKPFDLSKLSPAVQTALADVAKPAFEKIEGVQKTGNKVVNGSLLTNGTGITARTIVARGHARVTEGRKGDKDAMYPSTKDSDGKPLVGTNTYVVHFTKGTRRCVGGFTGS